MGVEKNLLVQHIVQKWLYPITDFTRRHPSRSLQYALMSIHPRGIRGNYGPGGDPKIFYIFHNIRIQYYLVVKSGSFLPSCTSLATPFLVQQSITSSNLINNYVCVILFNTISQYRSPIQTINVPQWILTGMSMLFQPHRSLVAHSFWGWGTRLGMITRYN